MSELESRMTDSVAEVSGCDDNDCQLKDENQHHQQNVTSATENLLKIKGSSQKSEGSAGNQLAVKNDEHSEVIAGLENLSLDVLTNGGSGRVIKRDLINIKTSSDGILQMDFANATYSRVGQKRTAFLMHVAAHCYQLKKTKRHATKRDVYYMKTQLYGDQRNTNTAVDDIACTLRVPRCLLNIGSTCKGIVAGPLKYKLRSAGGDVISVNVSDYQLGHTIPTEAAFDFFTSASFVLIIEKDCCMSRLIEDKTCEKLNCVLATGRGFPCIGTRFFLRRLQSEVRIPFFILTDADPFGINIALVYAMGSVALSHENKFLAIPSLEWIGLSPLEFSNLPKSSLLPCTSQDIKRAASLIKHPSIRKSFPTWIPALRYFLSHKQKAEIQSLQSNGLTYVSDVYLKQKLCDAP